jgi:hypothetical protein
MRIRDQEKAVIASMQGAAEAAGIELHEPAALVGLDD